MRNSLPPPASQLRVASPNPIHTPWGPRVGTGTAPHHSEVSPPTGWGQVVTEEDSLENCTSRALPCCSGDHGHEWTHKAQRCSDQVGPFSSQPGPSNTVGMPGPLVSGRLNARVARCAPPTTLPPPSSLCSRGTERACS